MRITSLFIAAASALVLSGCVMVPVTGTAPTQAPTASAPSLNQSLAGRTISNAFARHQLLPNGSINGRFISPDGSSYFVPGNWSVNGDTFCITVESDPLCGRGVINGDQFTHFANGTADVWQLD